LKTLASILPISFLISALAVVQKQRTRIKEWTRGGTTNEFKTFESIKKSVYYQVGRYPAFYDLSGVGLISTCHFVGPTEPDAARKSQIPRARKLVHPYLVSAHLRFVVICLALSMSSFSDHLFLLLIFRTRRLGLVARLAPRFDVSASLLPGYCGYASINTVICSVSFAQTTSPLSRGLLKYHNPGYVTQRTMMDLLERLCSEQPQLGLRNPSDLSFVDKETFCHIIRKDVADPRSRFLLCFHRAPLFFPSSGGMMVHWSPILAYLPNEDCVCVGDVNKDYGPWLVKPERLWDSCGDGIVEVIGGGRMGLVRLDVVEGVK